MGAHIQRDAKPNMEKLSNSTDELWDSAVMKTQDSCVHLRCFLDAEKQFGKGFCKNHPEVLASLVQASMTAYAASLIAAVLQESRVRN